MEHVGRARNIPHARTHKKKKLRERAGLGVTYGHRADDIVGRNFIFIFIFWVQKLIFKLWRGVSLGLEDVVNKKKAARRPRLSRNGNKEILGVF